jgi:hypothetical protein
MHVAGNFEPKVQLRNPLGNCLLSSHWLTKASTDGLCQPPGHWAISRLWFILFVAEDGRALLSGS